MPFVIFEGRHSLTERINDSRFSLCRSVEIVIINEGNWYHTFVTNKGLTPQVFRIPGLDYTLFAFVNSDCFYIVNAHNYDVSMLKIVKITGIP